MSLLKQITSGIEKKPRRVMLYGTHGIGKSTFGAMSESPIFIQTEDGLSDINCERFPLATDFKDVVAAVGALYTEDHAYQTLVIDSLDWLERLIFAKVCRDKNVKSIEDIGYGKGFVFAIDAWREVLTGLDALRSERDMHVILMAHAKVERFNNPDTEPYDRYAPSLDKRSSALVQEWCDEVLFASYRVMTKSVESGFNKKQTQGIGTGERIIRTTERPSHMAKNRLGLPDEIPLDFRAYAGHRDGTNTDTERVTNGSE